MTLHTGTFASANQAQEVMNNVLHQKIIDHPAWEYVEEVVGVANPNATARVYKCLGSLNAIGADFFIAIMRAANNSAFGVGLGESYDGATKKLVRPAIVNSLASPVSAEADFSYGTPRHVVDEHTIVAATTNGFIRGAGSTNLSVRTGVTAPTISVNYNYILSITNDTISFSTWRADTMAWNGGWHVGCYDSFHSLAVDPVPLICTSLQVADYVTATGTSEVGAFTREARSGALTGGFHAMLHPLWTKMPPVTGVNVPSKEFVSDRYWPSRMPVSLSGRQAAFKGLLKPHILATVHSTANPPALGDTMTIDGVVYSCLGGGGNHNTFQVVGAGGTVVGFHVGIWVSQEA